MKKLENAKLTKNILTGLEKEDRDLFLYSGPIDEESVNNFLDKVSAKQNRRKDVSLILTTLGGGADQAYRMARFLQKSYSTFKRVTVVGPCKSAGTLVAIGADELAFGLLGELGPLDVQLNKSDEIIGTKSGIDTLGTLAVMQTEAFNAFAKYMLDLTGKTKGAISMKTASDIAVNLVTGLFHPMIQQIDPHRLSEVSRMMKIAKEYGIRLGMHNLKNDTQSLDHLIGGYPSHRFIIDKKEAETIFKTVLDITDIERDTMKLYPDYTTKPSRKAKIIDVEEVLEKYFEKIDGENMLESNQEKMSNGITKEQGGNNEERTGREGA